MTLMVLVEDNMEDAEWVSLPLRSKYSHGNFIIACDPLSNQEEWNLVYDNLRQRKDGKDPRADGS